MNNVPYFLQHLPIWKCNLEDNKQNKNQRVKEHKYDAVDKHTGQMVEKVCQICGKKYKTEYRLSNTTKTCSKSCGQKLRMANKVPEKWVDKAVELRQQGLKLSAIAVVVNKSTSTVWQYLKKRGY